MKAYGTGVFRCSRFFSGKNSSEIIFPITKKFKMLCWSLPAVPIPSLSRLRTEFWGYIIKSDYCLRDSWVRSFFHSIFFVKNFLRTQNFVVAIMKWHFYAKAKFEYSTDWALMIYYLKLTNYLHNSLKRTIFKFYSLKKPIQTFLTAIQTKYIIDGSLLVSTNLRLVPL